MTRIFWHLKARWHETMAARSRRRAAAHAVKAGAAFQRLNAMAGWS